MLLEAGPALLLKAVAHGCRCQGLGSKGRRHIATESVDPGFERVVEHVADHQHATGHPLAGATEFGVVELRHATATAEHGLHHVNNGCGTEAVVLAKALGDLEAFLGDLFHGERMRPSVPRFKSAEIQA
ncbi:MAG: hypothetical protein ACRC1L_05855 [Prochlorococcaceae cyanobacterium]